MSSDSGEEDKQYEPSQKKLDDARKKGEVPKSNDLITSAGYAGFLVAIVASGAALAQNAGTALQVLLGQADDLSALMFGGGASAVSMGLAMVIGSALFPLFVLPFSFALLSAIIQRSLIFAPTKLAPKLSRISPIKGIGNKFGRSGLFEFFKSFLKLCIYSLVLGVFIWVQLPSILGTSMLTPGIIVVDMMRLCVVLFGIVIAISFVLGAMDFLFQHAEHMRKHRMSRKELTDEQKDAEGDPMMKAQRRQKAIEMAMNKMLADVSTADVVVVNPTHYAVALKWHRGSGSAPICVAKGTDEIAARIRELAMEHGVAIHRDPPAARAVHGSVNIGDPIHPEHYQAIAAAIRYAESLRARAVPK